MIGKEGYQKQNALFPGLVSDDDEESEFSLFFFHPPPPVPMQSLLHHPPVLDHPSQDPPSLPRSRRLLVSREKVSPALCSTMKILRTRKTPKKARRGDRVKKIPWELCQPYWITDNLVIEFHDELLEQLSNKDILEELD